MLYTIPQAIEILERTPAVLNTLLSGLSDDWVMRNEGPETFSAYDVVGHLIHGEKTDWVTRAKIILAPGDIKTFERWDRVAMYEESKDKSLQQLLASFAVIRKDNLIWFAALHLTKTI